MHICVQSRLYAYTFLYGLEPEELVNTFLYGLAFSHHVLYYYLGSVGGYIFMFIT